MNSINLIGRLTADVELKTTQSGVPVCSFTIAVKRPNVKDTTDFINCVAWRSTAEFISKYFSKGKLIALTGILTGRSYEDQNGKKRTAYEVVVERAEFCDSKADAKNATTTNDEKTATTTNDANFEEIADGDDLPF